MSCKSCGPCYPFEGWGPGFPQVRRRFVQGWHPAPHFEQAPPARRRLRATWEYEKLSVTGSSSATPYVRVLVGKVKKSQAQFEASVEKAEIVQDNPEWTDRSWVKAALAQLAKDGVLGDVRDWAKIEKESLAFAEKKKSEGRLDAWNGKAPTYDLTQKRETVK
ncbi:unnamed protein product [Parascedosporium putredinis]|uniref:Uncharacterized protein n=1 Tax=Parascedosporium putredinis TaxID=1442378 RepID=A0A9P1MC91_9PEZI|nr:unnamed protein product [Parascedosporium putredinis]CAI7997417.1 unnamed protein product [Parascedosporium putredinis]